MMEDEKKNKTYCIRDNEVVLLNKRKQQEKFSTFHLKSDKKNESGKTQVFTVIYTNLDQCLNFNEKKMIKLKHNDKKIFKTNNFLLENNIFDNKNDSSGSYTNLK